VTKTYYKSRTVHFIARLGNLSIPVREINDPPSKEGGFKWKAVKKTFTRQLCRPHHSKSPILFIPGTLKDSNKPPCYSKNEFFERQINCLKTFLTN